jgi:hypothetical protein
MTIKTFGIVAVGVIATAVLVYWIVNMLSGKRLLAHFKYLLIV